MPIGIVIGAGSVFGIGVVAFCIRQLVLCRRRRAAAAASLQGEEPYSRMDGR
jgi:hypothetical protein